MKPAKAVLALAATIGFTSAASAYTLPAGAGTSTTGVTSVIHVIGSTAYRNRVHLAIAHLMGGANSGASTQPFLAASTSSAKTIGNGACWFEGSIDGGTTTVIIETNFVGSISGLKGLTAAAAFPFIADVPVTTGAATAVYTVASGTTLPTTNQNGSVSSDIVTGLAATQTNSQVGDTTLCDVYQSASLFKTPILKGAKTPAGREIVGMNPFTWARSPSANAGISSITNITPQLIDLLYENASLPASLFTGNSADASSFMFAAGRDPDSGTRLTAFAEAGLGTNATVVQTHPASGGTNSTAVSGLSTSGSVTAIEIYPTDTVTNLGLTFTGGNGGENSGGTLMGYVSDAFALTSIPSGLGFTSIPTAGAFVAYSGTDDASGSIKAGAIPLSYCGFSISNTPALGTAPTYNFGPIQNGQYTFWGYEHMLYLSGASTTIQNYCDTIATQIYNFDNIFPVSSMAVSRPGDGGQVGPE